MSQLGMGSFARSPSVKLVVICILIVLLMIPLLLVVGLVSERQGRAASVASEVAQTWGAQQQLSGPFVIVPYTIRTQVRDGDKILDQTQERRAVFLPQELSIDGNAATQVLTRSIFEVNVFTARLSLTGRFAAPLLADVDANAISVRWSDASLVLALSDVSGLKEAANLIIDDSQTIAFQPSLGIPGVYTNGIHAKLGGTSEPLQAFSFRVDLVFSGSGQLTFAPAARETKVALSADWPHPSFMGGFLPTERAISDAGFTASWAVPDLARSVPQAWSLADAGVDRLGATHFGVAFYQPIDFYDVVFRAVKYGILFLALAFMAVFVLEIVADKRVHAVQYLFVGIAMIFFYVLLLSFSEHIGFLPAYGVASVATGGMLSMYVGKALRSLGHGLAMMVLFLVLYGFLYLILQLEDYALLAGAILGFAALCVVMFATLRVDWSGGRASESKTVG
jgi:inner membrane protein